MARISHAAELCPKGLYEIGEEDPNDIKLSEEFNLPGAEELKSLEAWGHKCPIILKVGRCSHTPPQGMGAEEQEEFLAK